MTLLNRTKIVIPDYLNNRIVQIDDINGTNWTAKTNSDIGFGSTLYPYDTDYDSRGRIYIANYSSSSGEDIVIRIDNIQSTSCVTIQSNSNSDIGPVSVDRINNLLYFSNGSDLFRSNLDGSNRITLIITGISSIGGLTFNDSNSMLYISCTYTGASRVVQYNPATQGIENISTTTNISDPASIPWDTLIRGSYVYVTNPGGSNGYLVLQLDSNLQYVNGYGTQTTSLNTNQGMFYNPRMFLAIRDDGIIMIDDLQGGPTALNKIISMQDITGAGWETFGSNGTGTNQFRFYYD